MTKLLRQKKRANALAGNNNIKRRATNPKFANAVGRAGPPPGSLQAILVIAVYFLHGGLALAYAATFLLHEKRLGDPLAVF